MKTVGLITWHYYHNFGSALQAYALQTAIEQLGDRCKILNYRNPKFGRTNSLKLSIQYLLSKFKNAGIYGFRKNNYVYPFVCFQKDFLHETKLYYNGDDISLRDIDILVCGSDQIWAPNVFNPVYMLDFAPDSVNKVSYAASIGLNEIPVEYSGIYTKLLSRFDSISVREETGRDLLKSVCSIDAQVVVDPTLLLSRTEWEKIEKKVDLLPDRYIFCYFLNENHRYRAKVQEFAMLHGLEIIGVSSNKNDASWMNILHGIGPSEFLYVIRNCDYVFTDSYHGTIFSLIFEKAFITFKRFKETDKISQNSRIYQLAAWFGIDSNIFRIEEYEPREKIYVDYQSVEAEMKKKIGESMDYLKYALK